MRLSDLEKEGIPRRVLDIWRGRQGESLLPVQRLAIRKGLLKEGRDGSAPPGMIISAPTSSGKSFCAELAAVRALTARRKTVMLFPLKSLAEEKYRRLKETFTPLGIKCLIVTGDHPENDAAFARGDYQLAVAIYEKFDLLLAADMDALKNIGLVVVDELQMIAEPGRGAVLERLLTRLVASTYKPTLVALSAVLGGQGATRLADWLGVELVEETTRPVDLIRGVAVEGSYRFRSYNSGEDGDEPFTVGEKGDSPEDTRLAGFINQVKTDGGSTLVFMKSRRDTVGLAFKLAAAVSWPPAQKALAALSDEEPSFLLRSLGQALGRGVAFHNSDLTPRQREVIEQAFIDKEVRVLFSTTTLAMGVNLPADTVYLETVKYTPGNYDSRPSLEPISRVEFDNMTGRAGRLDWKTDRPGRAIVLAESDFDRDILWENYIAPHEPEAVKSAFVSLPLEDWLLHFIACGLATGKTELKAVLGRTFYAISNEGIVFDIIPALNFLSENGLATVTGDAVAATVRGRAVVRAGLSVREGMHYQAHLDRAYPETLPGWTALALSSPFWVLPPGFLTRSEQAENLPLKRLYQHFEQVVGEIGFLLPEKPHHQPLSYRQAAALKALLLLDEWCRLVPAQRLEEQYQVHLGQIISLAETAAHLMTALAVLIEAEDRESLAATRLRDHAFSLRMGLPVSWQSAHRQLGDILNRADFSRFQQAGLKNLADLGNVSPEKLSGIICNDVKFKSLKEKVNLLKEEVDMQLTVSSNRRPLVMTGPEMIEIDGSFEQERYLVRINGFPVRLTGKSFKYFTKLAWSRLNLNSGWIYKEDIEVGFNQARYLYRMKNEINASLNMVWPVIENNRLGYYRLNVAPGKIKINRDNLKKHPDYEIRQLVTESDPVSSTAIN